MLQNLFTLQETKMVCLEPSKSDLDHIQIRFWQVPFAFNAATVIPRQPSVSKCKVICNSWKIKYLLSLTFAQLL